MLNLDPAKLLIIAVVAVILLGPDRLPAFACQVGEVWRSFTEYRHRMEAQVRSSMPDLPTSSEIARLARSPAALLDHLSTMSPDAEATSAVPAAAAAAPAEINVVHPNELLTRRIEPHRPPRISPGPFRQTFFLRRSGVELTARAGRTGCTSALPVAK